MSAGGRRKSRKREEGCQRIPAFVPEGMQKERISRMKDVFTQRRSIHRIWKKNAQKANFGRLGRYAISMIFLRKKKKRKDGASLLF